MKRYGVVGFIFGVGAGGAAGFYVGKMFAEKKATNEVEFKVSQIRNYYDSKFEALKNELIKEKMAEDARAEKEMAADEETTADAVTEEDIKTNEEIVQKCDYSAFSKKDTDEEIEGGSIRVDTILESIEIDEDEYFDLQEEGYRPVPIIFCAQDKTWFSEHDVPLNDMSSRIGIENTDMIAESVMDSGRDEDRWFKNEMTNEVFRIYAFDMDSATYMKGR